MNLDFLIFYVSDMDKSLGFYKQLLKKDPLQASPSFTMFGMDSGLTLALWDVKEVEPPLSDLGTGGEIGLNVGSNEALDAVYDEWVRDGLTIAQEPVGMGFGRTFTALDPDGHRLRVYAPKGR